MQLTEATALGVLPELDAAFRAARDRAIEIDTLCNRKDHPTQKIRVSSSKPEYTELLEMARQSWLARLVVQVISQGLFIEGYRQERSDDNAAVWRLWQANKMDSRQSQVYKSSLKYGDAYTMVLPGQDPLTGEAMPVIRPLNPKQMVALYEDPAMDDWPKVAARFYGDLVDVFGPESVFTFRAGKSSDGTTKWDKVSVLDHGAGVVPVVRWLCLPDEEGFSEGVVDPLRDGISSLAQTKLDRLLVQRHSSYKVRTVSGITLPEGQVAQQKIKLSKEDILVAENPDTKFGTLAESPLQPFIDAYDSDLRVIAAAAQIPPQNLLGAINNVNAETLAAAESGMSAQRDEHQHAFGESAEQTLRLAAKIGGLPIDAVMDQGSQVVWKDTRSRSLAQVVDALGKLTQMLGFPAELLWEKVPGITAQDAEAARKLLDEMDPLTQAMSEISGALEASQPEPQRDVVPVG